MPKLNEYIGSLVSSITNARVMSDIQTVKVAEEYNKHDLLKHFSIPRMRIDDIEMTIPIALETIEEKTKSTYAPIDNTTFNKLAYRTIVSNLGLKKLPKTLSIELRGEIAKQTKLLEENIQTTKNLNHLKGYSKILVQKELELKKALKSKVKLKSNPEDFEAILEPEINMINQDKSIDNLNVIVEAHKLREQKTENIIYIKLKISEDGMEWDKSENSAGETQTKLIPE